MLKASCLQADLHAAVQCARPDLEVAIRFMRHLLGDAKKKAEGSLEGRPLMLAGY